MFAGQFERGAKMEIGEWSDKIKTDQPQKQPIVLCLTKEFTSILFSHKFEMFPIAFHYYYTKPINDSINFHHNHCILLCSISGQNFCYKLTKKKGLYFYHIFTAIEATCKS